MAEGKKVPSRARYLPWVACILAMKIYVMTLLINSRSQISKENSDYEYEDDVIDAPNRSSIKSPFEMQATTEEPFWREKQEILATLNDTTLVASATNRTPETIWLFFNRVPRSGGQTLVALLKALGEQNEFQHTEHTYRTPWQRLLTEEEQRNLATWFEYNFWPKSYDRFCLHVNFTEFRSKYVTSRPAYVTLVRDPVEKFISNFRSKRIIAERSKMEMAGREREKPGSGRKWFFRKLEECVEEEDEECKMDDGSADFVSSVSFLCGQHEHCVQFGDKWALQRAKFHAEYEYAVVGVLEHWNQTMSVLDQYLPVFFKGVLQQYYSPEFARNRFMNKNPKKYPPVPPNILQKLRQRMPLEYELYEFLCQRLQRQFDHIKNRLQEPVDDVTTTEKTADGIESLSAWDRLDIELLH